MIAIGSLLKSFLNAEHGGSQEISNHVESHQWRQKKSQQTEHEESLTIPVNKSMTQMQQSPS
jgi:hypothetical protein